MPRSKSSKANGVVPAPSPSNARSVGSANDSGVRSAHGGKATRRSRASVVVAVLALLLGAAVFAYPMVSDHFYQLRQQDVVHTQATAVDNVDHERIAEEKQRAIDYNAKLLNSRTVITDPFDPNAQRVTDEEYESVLNLNGDGVMGTITIPKIKCVQPIYHGTDDETLENGVGHLQETSVPIGGESTHAVLSGHTGLPNAKIFDNLDQLEVGDYFIITVLGEDHAYRVTSTEVVLPDETDSLVIQPGKDLCTLVTCTPYGINTHRLLVHAERCEVPEEWLDKGDSAFPAGYSDPPDKALLPSVLLGLALAAAIIGGYAGVRRLRSRCAARRAAAAAAVGARMARGPMPGARSPYGGQGVSRPASGIGTHAGTPRDGRRSSRPSTTNVMPPGGSPRPSRPIRQPQGHVGAHGAKHARNTGDKAKSGLNGEGKVTRPSRGRHFKR